MSFTVVLRQLGTHRRFQVAKGIIARYFFCASEWLVGGPLSDFPFS
jgi:hypothetical protein